MLSTSYGIVFPGQGSQSVGMLADIAKQYTEVKDTFNEASSVLGFDLWRLVEEGPKEELDKTINTQPALLASAYAIWRILKSRYPLRPRRIAGHSLGEYTALVAADAMHFADAIKIVALRGKWMQEAVPSGLGAMAAILGLDEESIVTICEKSRTSKDEVVSPANFNAIGQTVIAGHKEAVLRALQYAKEQGAKTIVLPVSVPSHCLLMTPAAKQLQALLATVSFHIPTIPVINNVDVTPYNSVESIRDGLVRQLTMPVRWVLTIRAFVDAGVGSIIECGPGKILTGLNKRIDSHLTLMTTCDVSQLEELQLE